jgi:hypothetical protein
VTLRILSLAEVDLLAGFRFYERQGKVVALVGIFSNHLTLTLNPFDSMPARIDAPLVIIECSRNDFRSPSIMTCTRTKSEFGVCWIAEAIRAGSSAS